MTRSAVLLFSVLAMLASTSRSPAGEGAGGHLFIIGGGSRPASLMQEFVDLAGGRRARILVLPLASGIPDTVGPEQVEELRALGAARVGWTVFSRQEAEEGAVLPFFDDVTGVFFSGGVQSRITETILRTPVHDRLLELYHDGAVIGGTSAGAAMMSEVMITGDEQGEAARSRPFGTVRSGTVVTAPGLGMVRSMVIDQHFIARRRFARLLSVVLERPSLIGVGIDESTAIVVGPGPGFRVTGEGSVLVIDARAAEVRVDSLGNLGASGMRLHLLLAGETFSP